MTRRDQAFLVLRAQSGDREALDKLFRNVQDRLWRCSLSIVGHHELAEDVLQDVFVILQKKLTWLREPEYFDGWALRITAREAIRRATKESRIGRAHDARPLERVVDERAADPLERLVAERLKNLVAGVPTASRAVLVLHYLEELTLPEVASVLGIPIGTAKSRLAYGLEFLRKSLADRQSIDSNA